MPKYRLLIGMHVERRPKLGPDGKQLKAPAPPEGNGQPIFYTHKYRSAASAQAKGIPADDLIETDADLLVHNKGGARKFELVDDASRADRSRITALEAEIAALKSALAKRNAPPPEAPDAATLRYWEKHPESDPRRKDEADAAPSPKPKDADADSDADLDSFTIAELREIATREGVDLTGKHRKDEIVEAIEEARAGD